MGKKKNIYIDILLIFFQYVERRNDQEEAREIFVQLPMETSVTLVITKCPIIASVNHIKAPDPFAMRLIEL